jgi:hypothetical protein
VKLLVAPGGSPETLQDTSCFAPFNSAVTVQVVDEPAGLIRVVGEAERLKSNPEDNVKV